MRENEHRAVKGRGNALTPLKLQLEILCSPYEARCISAQLVALQRGEQRNCSLRNEICHGEDLLCVEVYLQ